MKLKTIITLILIFISIPYLQGCGRAYFPIELKTKDRSERLKGQEEKKVEFISLTVRSTKIANKEPYKRKVVLSGDLNRPAKLVSPEKILNENLPTVSDPGPYVIGIGDQITFSRILSLSTDLTTSKITVMSDGFINLVALGKIKVEGLTIPELEDVIFKKLLRSGLNAGFELSISSFNSKKIFIYGDRIDPLSIPYVNVPLYLEDVINAAKIKREAGSDSVVNILRKGETYSVSLQKVLTGKRPQIRLFPFDKVYITEIKFKDESVKVVGETGTQNSIKINASERHTLSDIIFSGSVLNTVTSDFSQIYVIRNSDKHFHAYHLDITNPSRINLASSFEMRPDDIVFVATQPLSLYSRTLSQILGSTGLTLQARDAIRTELGN